MKILEKIRKNLYLIIPNFCIILWPLYYLISKKFLIYDRYWDFVIFYNAGIQTLVNPSQLYSVPHFYYLPSFSLFFAIFIAIFPYVMAYYVSYLTNMVLGLFFIKEYDKVLILMNLKMKIYRFLFLLLISNGWFLYYIYTFTQTKLFVGLVTLYILRRELQFNKNNMKKDLKYFLLNYAIFIFAIGMAPSFILLFLIYLFHDIEIKHFFKKSSIIKYCIAIIMFFIQNFFFIIYPRLILDFLEGLNWGISHEETKCCFLFTNPFPNIYSTPYSLISTIILLLFTVFLLINNKIPLEKKFGYFSFAYLFFGMFNCFDLLHILLAFSLLLYISYLNQNEKIIEFVKNNKLILLNLLSVAGINLIVPQETIFKYFPIAGDYPFNIIISLRYVILFFILGISFLLLIIMKNRSPNNNREKLF